MKNFTLSRKGSSIDLEKQNSELGKKNLQMKWKI